jgi:hypothetical protein
MKRMMIFSIRSGEGGKGRGGEVIPGCHEFANTAYLLRTSGVLFQEYCDGGGK